MTLIDKVKAKVKDAAGQLTDPDDFESAIAGALERYSESKPRSVAEDLPGAGSNDIALPAGWVEEFSTLRRVEYPVDEVPESLIDPDAWYLYQAPGGWKLRLIEVQPTALETVRVTYTVPRLEADIVQGDLDAVADLAASICLRTLAALAGQTSDPTIQADVVNRQSKTDEFRRLADAFEARYNAHMGIDPKGGAPAASAIAAAPARTRTRLTHS